jgi:hypothetical protein
MKTKLLYFLVFLVVIAMASLTGAAEEYSTDMQVDVYVDAREDNHGTWNYQSGREKFRQFVHNNEYMNIHSNTSFNDKAEDSYGLIKQDKVAKTRKSYTREQLSRLVKNRFPVEEKNVIGFGMADAIRGPYDSLMLIIEPSADYLILNLAIMNGYTELNEQDSIQLFHDMSERGLNMRGKVIQIFGEGAKKILDYSNWSVGVGGFGSGVVTSEKMGFGANAGIGVGGVKAGYAQPPWMHASIGRMYHVSVVYDAYLEYRKAYCEGKITLNDRYRPDDMSSAADEEVDLALIEDWIFGYLAQYGCDEDLPPEIITWDKFARAEKQKKAVPESSPAGAKKETVEPSVLQEPEEAPFTVYFDFDKHNIRDKKEQDAINGIEKWILSNVEDTVLNGLRIILLGSASNEGTPEYNAVLARLRAKTVFSQIDQPVQDKIDQLAKKDQRFRGLKTINIVHFASASKDLPDEKNPEAKRNVRVFKGKVVAKDRG